MRIAIVCPDASSNALVRTYPIAKVLARRHTLQVVGFRFGAEVFAPYRNEFDYDVLKARDLPPFYAQVRHIASRIDADAIYVFKPLPSSLWVGLVARRLHGIPLLLDIEDWEMSWFLERSLWTRARQLIHLEQPNGMFWTWVTQHLASLADETLVVSRFLQRRFGGTLLVHGADTTAFDPSIWPDRLEAQERLGVKKARYVVFTGSPNRRKGLHDLLEAVERLGDRSVRVLVVGSFHQDPGYRDELVRNHGERLTILGPRPHHEMPLCLAAADVVALPQRPSLATQAQVPGKVFEAMAMARPIVATAMSDLPEILDGCGVVVGPGSVEALAKGLEELLSSPDRASRLGNQARARCVDVYSWDAMERVLRDSFARLTLAW